MGLFSRLAATIAAAGGGPQVVTPTGWVLAGQSVPMVRNNLTFATNITPDLALGTWLVVTATSNAAFAMQNPIYNGVAISASNAPPIGLAIVITVFNLSGGALGAFTMPGTMWAGSAAFAAPGNNQLITATMVLSSLTRIVAVTNWSTATAV